MTAHSAYAQYVPGFPASDKSLYAYFQTSTSDPEVRVEAFLCALFDVLDTTIQSEYDDPTVPLAAWFRHRMTAGQTFLSHNEKRVTFYSQVVAKAHVRSTVSFSAILWLR